LKDGALIDVFLLMGGAKIIVPKDWNVILDTSNIMGDSKDKNWGSQSTEDVSKTLKINGLIVMGGLEVVRN
jgi:predicted membrane protein